MTLEMLTNISVYTLYLISAASVDKKKFQIYTINFFNTFF